MEQIEINLPVVTNGLSRDHEVENKSPFIEANTIHISQNEISQEHIIPVFVKDNEPLISHAEFIEATSLLATDIFWIS